MMKNAVKFEIKLNDRSFHLLEKNYGQHFCFMQVINMIGPILATLYGEVA